MAFLDGPVQVLLLIVVFCCPIIPAGGWCWLKCIECCLQCLGSLVKNVRRWAYVPMYLCLLSLLIAGCLKAVPDFLASERTEKQCHNFILFLITTGLSIFTFLISVHSTVKVLKGQVSIDEQRERTVYIIALPTFYSLMCFLASDQLLDRVLGTVDEHWAWEVDFHSDKERTRFTLDMMTFYMSAADVFESFAFTFFGMLTMESMRRAAQQQSRSSAREARLQSCIQRWTMTPIYMFCAVLCSESVYNLILIFAKYFHLSSIIPPAFDEMFKGVSLHISENTISIAFFTFTSIFSTLAIMALFSIEHVFHEDLASVDFVLDCALTRKCKFLSNLKFWGVKLFVTAEFGLQCGEFILRKMHFEEMRIKLIFTTCMASLCFLIAILHIFAYAPQGRWILPEDSLNRELSNIQSQEEGVQPGLERDASGVSLCPTPPGDQAMSTKLLSQGCVEKGLPQGGLEAESTQADDSASLASLSQN